MAQTLTSFCAEQQEKLRLFEDWWIAQNKIDPEAYPMTIQDGNEGAWWEMLQEFEASWIDMHNA